MSRRRRFPLIAAAFQDGQPWVLWESGILEVLAALIEHRTAVVSDHARVAAIRAEAGMDLWLVQRINCSSNSCTHSSMTGRIAKETAQAITVSAAAAEITAGWASQGSGLAGDIRRSTRCESAPPSRSEENSGASTVPRRATRTRADASASE